MKNNFKVNISRSIFQLIAALLIFTIQMQSFAQDTPQAGNVTDGGKAWVDNCTRCHNMRSPDDLTDEQWVTSVYHMRVRAGLTGQETRDILSFLQASNRDTGSQAQVLKGDQVTRTQTNAPIDGESIFAASCVACHGANGKGTLPGVPDLTQQDGRLSQSEEVLLANIINGVQSAGSPMPMPARGGNSSLTDEELIEVLDYILLTFRP
jgi:mono/diheme cytochrome c family protein